MSERCRENTSKGLQIMYVLRPSMLSHWDLSHAELTSVTFVIVIFKSSAVRNLIILKLVQI